MSVNKMNRDELERHRLNDPIKVSRSTGTARRLAGSAKARDDEFLATVDSLAKSMSRKSTEDGKQ